MINWTDNQKTAIESREKQILVGAAAGSGKTAVLVERVLSILTDEENKVPAERIVVVTFTRAAAAEMKDRLAVRLLEIKKQKPDNVWIREQYAALPKLNMSTVHSFCLKLLGEFFGYLELPSKLRVMSDVEADEIFNKALDITLEQLYSEESYEFDKFSDLFGRAKDDETAVKVLIDFHRFITSLPDAEKWKESFLDGLTDSEGTFVSGAIRILSDYAKSAVEYATETIQEAKSICLKDEILKIKSIPALDDDLSFFQKVLELLEQGKWNECVKYAENFKHIRFNQIRGNIPEQKDYVYGLRDGIKDVVKDLKRKCFIATEKEFESENEIIYETSKRLFSAVNLLDKNLAELKIKKRVLNYDDIERYTVKLLSLNGEEGEKVRSEIASRYDYILVDEFQDTNLLQERIFSLISEDKGSFFAVGDVKQSIFRFRKAEPDVFVQKQKAAQNDDSGISEFIPLSHNFRSERNIIDVLNLIFKRIMSEKIGGVDYKNQEEMTSLKEEVSKEPGLELHLIENSENDKADEVNYVAGLIKSMIDSGYEVSEDDVKRKCRAGDFCILMRKKENMALYEEQLSGLGIKTNSIDQSSFVESSEISTILALLGVVANPTNDIDMSATMLSPLFGFTPDDLLRLRITEKRGSLYRAMLRSKDAKVIGFLEQLNEWRQIAVRQPLDILIEEIMFETSAEEILSSGRDSEKRSRNLRLLLNMASDMSKNNVDLSGFLRMLRSGKRDYKQEFDNSRSEDKLTISTIHSAKGLEWPIVFFVETNGSINLQDSWKLPMLFDREYGIGLKYVKGRLDGSDISVNVKTPQYKALSLNSELQAKSEEMRLLYVALTRAKQKIIATAAYKNRKAPVKRPTGSEHLNPTAVQDENNFMSWMLMAVSKDRSSMSEDERKRENSLYSIKYIDKIPEISPETETGDIEKVKVDKEELLKILEFDYPASGLIDMKSKYTVSELTEKEYVSDFVRTPSFAEKTGATAAEKGTAIHSFLQHADYFNANRSLEEEIKRLVDSEFITSQTAELLDREKLIKFFESEIFPLVTDSDSIREIRLTDFVYAHELNPDLPDEFSDEIVVVEGKADCVVVKNNGVTLIDYKTDRISDPKVLVERYATQLKLYKRAVERKFNKPVVKMYIYSFYQNAVIEA